MYATLIAQRAYIGTNNCVHVLCVVCADNLLVLDGCCSSNSNDAVPQIFLSYKEVCMSVTHAHAPHAHTHTHTHPHTHARTCNKCIPPHTHATHIQATHVVYMLESLHDSSKSTAAPTPLARSLHALLQQLRAATTEMISEAQSNKHLHVCERPLEEEGRGREEGETGRQKAKIL